MDRLIYTALSGASQTLYEQQISANNLANVNTNGFRADMAMATNDKVKGGGFDTRYMAQEGASGVNDSTGVAEKTERPLDVAIQGAGYIAVQDKNGNEVYTRNGNIQQDDQGQLAIDGNLVLGDNGPIILPPNAIASFGSDGTLSVTPDDGDVTATMDIDRLKLVDIPVANLAKNPEGMLITADGVPAQRDENIKVSGGFLEGSNVSAVSEMMSSIAMNAALWISKTGLSAQDAEMSAIANNIANVNTTGFKRDRVMFQDLFYQTQEAPGAMLDQNNIMPTGLQFGSGVRIVGTQKTFTEGNVETTDNAMNVAIMGQGFLQVQKANGDIAYTRDGNLQVNADGVLTNSQGLPLQPEIDVPAGATNVAFGEDGTVTAILPGDSDATELGQLTLVNFANPAGLSAEGDNLYLETAASGQPTEGVPGEDGLGTLQDNALEGSNVDIVNEMVAMITVQRAYEMNAKMVSAADDMLQYISQTL